MIIIFRFWFLVYRIIYIHNSIPKYKYHFFLLLENEYVLYDTQVFHTRMIYTIYNIKHSSTFYEPNYTFRNAYSYVPCIAYKIIPFYTIVLHTIFNKWVRNRSTYASFELFNINQAFKSKLIFDIPFLYSRTVYYDV